MTIEITINIIIALFVALWCLGSLLAWLAWNRVAENWKDDLEIFDYWWSEEPVILVMGGLGMLVIGNFFWWQILKREVQNG